MTRGKGRYRKSESRYFTYSQRSHKRTDFNKILPTERYGGRNHHAEKLRGYGYIGGSNLLLK